MLRKLVEDAKAGPPPRLPGVSLRLRHSTHFTSADESSDATLKEPFCAVDVKVCYDGEWLYAVMLDASGTVRCVRHLP